jgi:uncharacterized protein YrrD
MVIKGSDVMGLKIMAVKENKEVGTVKDLVYDPKKNQVAGLLVSFGDVLGEARVLPFKEIKEINNDAVLAKSEKSIKPASKAIKPMPKPDNSDSFMKDTDVETPEGKQMGNFRDLYFDTKSGKVSEFEVQDSNQPKKVPVKKVVTSTESATVVKEKSQGGQEENGIMGTITKMIGMK